MTTMVWAAALGLGAMFGLQSRLLHINPVQYLLGVATDPAMISDAIRRLGPMARNAFNLTLAAEVAFGSMVLVEVVRRML